MPYWDEEDRIRRQEADWFRGMNAGVIDATFREENEIRDRIEAERRGAMSHIHRRQLENLDRQREILQNPGGRRIEEENRQNMYYQLGYEQGLKEGRR